MVVEIRKKARNARGLNIPSRAVAAVVLAMACGDEPRDLTEADLERCVLNEGACRDGCTAMQGRPYRPGSGQTCLDDFEVIGCYPENAQLTSDDRCAKSPESWLVMGSGTLLAHLIRREGFSVCSDEERATLVALDLCP